MASIFAVGTGDAPLLNQISVGAKASASDLYLSIPEDTPDIQYGGP
jgi:hypothetical protein